MKYYIIRGYNKIGAKKGVKMTLLEKACDGKKKLMEKKFPLVIISEKETGYNQFLSNEF